MEDKSQIWPKQLILWKHSRQVALYRSRSMMRKLIQSHKQIVHKFPSEKDDERFVTLGSPKVVGPVVGPYLWLFGFDYCDESLICVTAFNLWTQLTSKEDLKLLSLSSACGHSEYSSVSIVSPNGGRQKFPKNTQWQFGLINSSTTTLKR